MTGTDIILSSGQNVTLVLNNLSHNWAGDLTITLTHGGITGTVVDRVGRYGNGAGDGSNYNGTYGFNNGFAGDLWAASSSPGALGTIPGGNYFPSVAHTGTPADVFRSVERYEHRR